MSAHFELFPGKDLSGLFRDIYNNQVQKKKKINELIEEIRKLVKNSQDLSIIAPLINDMIGQSVKNDEHLLKLATIAQRIVIAERKTEGEEGFLTEEEKRALLDEVENVSEQLTTKTDDLTYEVDEIKNQVNKQKGKK